MPNRLNFRRDGYCRQDGLGFDKYIDTLSSMILDRDFETPFCIGIYGKWGSGKTSFMRLLEQELAAKGNSEPYPLTVWFNPWRYEKEEHLIIPFLKTIEQSLDMYAKERKSFPRTMLNHLKRGAQKISDASAAFAYGLKADCKLGKFGIAFDTAKAAQREEELGNKRRQEAEKLSKKLTSIYYDIANELSGAVDKDVFRIVVFIDDLDRCLPEKAVELLESVKLFLDLEGYLFVLGVDKEVVEEGIRHHYRFYDENAEGASERSIEKRIISPDDYLDKMIQVPLELPPIEPTRKLGFIIKLLGDSAYSDHAAMIEAGVEENPRTLTRFVNYLAFMGRLGETLKESIKEANDSPGRPERYQDLLEEYFSAPYYVKWAIIVFSFPEQHRIIKGKWQHLLEMQEAVLSPGKKEEGAIQPEEKVNVPERLKKVLRLGRPFPDEPWVIQTFIYLASSVSIATTVAKAESLEKPGRHYKPGQMVLVRKGVFLYGEEKQKQAIDYDYYIDAYPVTNRHYKAFLDSNAEQGRAYDVPYVEEEWAKPYNWDKDTRQYPEGKGDHPVVLVSYRDAEAFCKWRSEQEDKAFRLPTEKEWEKAARGEDGRDYPWGVEFDKNKCNTEESGKKCTTPVDEYPDGASPYGCFDMAGNVWEWCDSWYDEGEQSKVLRGGSWFNYRFRARCAFRYRLDPFGRYFSIGFRCARTSE